MKNRAAKILEQNTDTTATSGVAPARKRPAIRVAKTTYTEDDATLGQFIPIHYHYQMLDQEPRIAGFEAAINAVVKPGMKVLELGAGTGVLSFFAARAGASKVTCVERVPHVAQAAQEFLANNGVGDRIEMTIANANEYTPREPVDVVICEMLHTGMLREKQLEVIKGFKERYMARFGNLPRFIPEAAVLAVQTVETNYDFHGYNAPVPMFIDGSGNGNRTTRLAAPILYAMFEYASDFATTFTVDEEVIIERDGVINGLRLITKNLLAMIPQENRSIDWDMHDLVVPVKNAVTVKQGDVLRIKLTYEAGASLLELQRSIDGDD